MSCLRLTNILRVFNKQKQELIDTEVDRFQEQFLTVLFVCGSTWIASSPTT
jgi:hypothetical protein